MLDIKITRTTCPKEKPQDETKLGFGKKFTRLRSCSTTHRRSLRA